MYKNTKEEPIMHFDVSSGESLVGNILEQPGDSLRVFSGGITYHISVPSGGRVEIYSGGKMISTTVTSIGKLFVYPSGLASSTVISSGGFVLVSQGGKMTNTTICSGGTLWQNGGIAQNTVVSSGGLFHICGEAYNNSVCSGGTLTLAEGKMTGRMIIESGAHIVTGSGTTVDFNISELGSHSGDTTRINNLSLIKGSPVFTLTISDNQPRGTYYLARGAEGFNKTISVVNTLGTELGTFAVGETITINNINYTLNLIIVHEHELVWGILAVNIKDMEPIDTVAPTISNIKADITAPTDQSVTVTASFSDDVELASALYRIGEEEKWLNYENGVIVTRNTTIYFKAIDASGNESVIQSYKVSNIIQNPEDYNNAVLEKNTCKINSGQVLTNVTVNSGGSLCVYSQGAANNTTVNSNGTLYVTQGVVNNTTVNSIGSLFIYSGGVANNTMINTSGGLYVTQGEVNNTTVNSRGSLYINSKGVANNTTVNAGGRLVISSGGVASNISCISSGFCVDVLYGGKITGVVKPMPWSISVSDGGIIDFDISNLSNDATTLFENYYMISTNVSTNPTLTITVSENQAEGTYSLATKAWQFEMTDTIWSFTIYNTSHKKLGSIKIGQTITVDSFKYALNLSPTNGQAQGGDLSLTVVRDSNGSHTDTEEVSSTAVIISKGSTVISAGQISSGLVVSSGGTLYVSSGGTSLDTVWTPCEGHVYVKEGGSASFVSQYSGVYYGSDNRLLSHVEAANGLTIGNKYEMNIMSGGTATSSLISGSMEGGTVVVSSGGTANSTILLNRGDLDVSSGGEANNTVIGDGWGNVNVYNGGIANNTTILSGGNMYVNSGAIANDIYVEPGGYLCVKSGGTATVHGIEARFDFSVASNTYIYLNGVEIKDAFVSGLTVRFEQGFSIHSGAIASNIIIDSVGGVIVFSGGVARDTTVRGQSPGVSGSVIAYGNLFVEGSAENTTISSYGKMSVSSNGMANSTTVHGLGNLYISEGGIATTTTINSGGHLYISGGTAKNTTVGSKGYIYVVEGGYVNSSVIKGELHLSSGCVGENTVISSGGTFLVRGTAINTTVKSGGSFAVVFSGKMTGQTVIEQGAIVSAWSGVSLDFDISQNETVTRVNNLSLISGWDNNACFTLTIADFQTNGIYSLANGAEGFNKTITVVNSSGIELGTLAVGTNITVNEIDYTLNLIGDSLTVTAKALFDNIAPTVANVMPYITTPTNGNVFVTATFSDDIELASALYRIGEDGEWHDYENGVVVTENATVYFKAIDAAGNESDVAFYRVANIDRTPPKKPVASADVTSQTEKNVLVTATFSNDCAMKEYQLNGGEWKAYTGAILFTENGFVSFRGIDEAGNVSEIETFQVSNIVPNYEIFSNNILENGALNIHSGQQYVNTTINNGGVLYVEKGGVASKTTVNNDGELHAGLWTAEGGGITNETTINGGYLAVYRGGIASNTVVNSGGRVFVSSGGTVEITTIQSAGRMYVSSSGIANKTTISSGGSLYVYRGGTITNTTVGPNGSMVLAGFAEAVTATDMGIVTISSGGTANSVILNSGVLFISSGGTATGIVENGGYVELRGGSAEFASHTFSGIVDDWATVHSGTTAFNTVVGGSMGWLRIYDGGIASNTTINLVKNQYKDSMGMHVYSGGTASNIIVNSGGRLLVSSGGKLTGSMTVEDGAVISACGGAIMDFDISGISPTDEARVNDLSFVKGTPMYSLTVSMSQTHGSYMLADGAAGFNRTISVVNDMGTQLGSLVVGGGKQSINGTDYSLNLDNNGLLSVTVESAVSIATKTDIDGNGISDVMFVWAGTTEQPGNNQHGYWLNGTNEWQSANSGHPAEWENLGCHDMTGDGKADSVLVGNVVVNDVKGAYIGYYADANDTPDGSTWVNIGYLNNADDISWCNKVGNLTGAAGKNSVVWFAPELCALGVWTDGTDDWVSISSSFDSSWALVGCGDFDGDGKDSVVMTLNNGQAFYAADLDGTASSLGSADWSGWTVRAIGDFAGDSKDDMVLFHQETGSMVMFADGSADSFESIGQLDAKDWFVVGAGDYNGDQKDDLLVRQYSTGMLGYYTSGDTTQWNVLGYGVDMSWTVIA